MSNLSQIVNYAKPKLKKKEERKLLVKAKAGDIQARDILIQTMIPYGIKLAERHFGNGMVLEDYVQLAIIGIIEAINHFNLDYQCRLITYVTWRVKKEITFAKTKGEIIRCPAKRVPKNIVEIHPKITNTSVEKELVEPDDLWFMEFLSDQDKRFLELRFFNKLTLSQIGEQYDLTRERARQKLLRLIQVLRLPRDKVIKALKQLYKRRSGRK